MVLTEREQINYLKSLAEQKRTLQKIGGEHIERIINQIDVRIIRTVSEKTKL